MAFTADERVQIRKWMGAAEIWREFDPRLESAMTAVEQASPGGEASIRSYLGKLDQIEQAELDETLNCIGNVQIGNIRQDNVRGVAVLRQLGRRYVGIIAHALGFEGPISDVFSAPPTTTGVHPLSHVPPLGGWPS